MSIKSTPLFLLLSFFVSKPFVSNAQAINVQDSLALIDLYNSTDGPHWGSKNNWLTKNPVNTWERVSVTGTRVTGLQLSYNYLKGHIPSSFGNLSNLSTLDLTFNKLSGSISIELSKLVNLISLNMAYNELSDSIPNELGNLVNLEVLDMSYNELSGSIPPELGNLVNLTDLDLRFNQLSGSIPSSIGSLKNLRNLVLTYNQVSGNIPFEIGNLSNLYGLYLYHNKLTGSIPFSIGNLTNLIELNIQDNELNGTIPSSIGNLVNLSNLYLSDNKLTGNIPPELGNLSKLKLLWLFQNELSGSIPSELGNLKNLTVLGLGNNQLTGNIPPQIGKLRYLEDLYLYYNQLSGNIPPELGRLKAYTFLGLNNNNLSGSIPPEISFHSAGNIANNYFTFNGMEPFAQKNYTYYNPQAIIPLHQNNNSLYVSAGGTLGNNTYKWFMVGAPDSTTIAGDSVFYPSQNGKYFAKVTNSICTQLTLYTDTVEYSSVLPVTIVNLKAQQQGNIIKVDWSSLTEINVASYEIQRSLNGRDFSAVGSVAAKNNGTQQTGYTFYDLQPAIGNNYYRLKLIDEDGKKTYSNIVSLKVNSDKTFTLVYPVPARDVLHIQTNAGASFSLIDQLGKILLMQNINGNGTINISGIATGFYYLKNNTNSTLQKVIISR